MLEFVKSDLMEEYELYFLPIDEQQTSRVRRWFQNVWSYVGWDDYIAVFLIVLGISGYCKGFVPYVPTLTEIYFDLRIELISIGVGVLIIANAGEVVSRNQEKRRLLLQMGSQNSAFAIEAYRQIVSNGWHKDGTLKKAKLVYANLTKCKICDADMELVDFSGANLSKAFLARINLKNGRLEYANLSDAIIDKVDFQRACLDTAEFKNVTMESVDFTGASLQFVTFWDSHLKGVVFCGADLSHANFQGANLRGVDFRNAIFDETSFWSIHPFDQTLEERENFAKYDSYTIWPNGFNPKSEGLISVDDD